MSGFKNEALKDIKIPGVTIVRDEKGALEILEILKEYNEFPHAWDTETIDLEIKEESPVGNGHIICA